MSAHVKMILPFGDPFLRKVAKPVDGITPKITKLLDNMRATLYAAEGRAGLAAPQVGILRRVVVMDCGDGLIEMINPEIIEQSGEQVGAEGCLSLPGHTGIVKRAQTVKVRARNRDGEEIVIDGEGFLARCMQHEIDHLNGILYIDHIVDGMFYNEATNERARLLDVIRVSFNTII